MNDHLLAQMIIAERLSKNHRSWQHLAADLKNSLAGASGESRTLALLKRELDLKADPIILTDLSLPYKEGYAQIDLLLLHQGFICVVEVKNIKGEFFFDSDNFQFHRRIDGRLEGMRNPESQLHRAVKAAEKILAVPVHGVIVLASRSGRVVEGPKNYPVVSLDYLPFYLEELVEKNCPFEIEALHRKLKSLSTKRFLPNLFERYQISEDSLRLGVTCPKCRDHSLSRANRKWKCMRCSGSFNDAHEVTL